MEVKQNETGGRTVVLTAGDRLRAVPRSHRDLISDAIRAVFRDVPGYFSRVARETPIPRMADWLQTLIWEDRWSLVLHRSRYELSSRVGFQWMSDTVLGAEVGLPVGEDTTPFPDPLAQLFRLVGFVDWCGFGVGGGGLSLPDRIMFVRHIHDETAASTPQIDWDKTWVCGGFNGDCLFATENDLAGWIGMNSEVKIGGTIAQVIDWWFGALLKGRSPTMDDFKKSSAA